MTLIKERAIDAGAIAATAALVVGAWWTAGVVHDRGESFAAGPHPTVTVTRTPEPVTTSPTPTPTDRPDTAATTVAERPAAGPAGASGGSPGTPHPPPRSPPAPAPSCAGRILAVRLPLGVLPDCAITLGGSR